MAIIIPSKNTYNINHSITNQNAVSSIEYQLVNLVTSNKLQDIYKTVEDVEDDIQYPQFFSPEGVYPGTDITDIISKFDIAEDSLLPPDGIHLAMVGSKPIYKEITIIVPIQLTNRSFEDVTKLITVSVDKTVFLRERLIRINADYYYNIILNKLTFDKIKDYENNTSYEDRIVSKPRTVEHADIPYIFSAQYTYENKVTTVDVDLRDQVTDTDKYNYIFGNKIAINPTAENGNMVIPLKILCGLSFFEYGGVFTKTGYPIVSLYEYRPREIEININGFVVSINEEDDVVVVGSTSGNGNHISIKRSLLSQNKDYASNKASQLLNNYSNGKETATIRCSISQYYDEKGKLVISSKNADKMLFEHYDKVVPMVRSGRRKELAMSYTADGLAKVFDVVGVRVFFDGAVWQELTLRESGEGIDIGRTTYTTIPNKARGLTYKITSNEIVTEQNSASGITYIIGD